MAEIDVFSMRRIMLQHAPGLEAHYVTAEDGSFLAELDALCRRHGVRIASASEDMEPLLIRSMLEDRPVLGFDGVRDVRGTDEDADFRDKGGAPRD